VRVCLVSPYAWDRPSEANDHLHAVARGLAGRGHEVVVLAPARRSAPLADGRRRLRAAERGDATALTPAPGEPLVVAVGLAIPLAGAARRRLSVPVSVAAGTRTALGRGRFDVVDALDPDVPGASSVALRESPAPTVATFARAGPPPLRTPRAAERLADRADAVAAVSSAAADRALRRFGLHAIVISPAVDTGRFTAGPPASPALAVVEATVADSAALRTVLAELDEAGAEVVLLRSAGAAAARALAPAHLAPRLRIADASGPAARAALLRGARLFAAATHGSALLAREAAACGVPIVALRGAPGAEGIEHERSGLLAPAEEPAHLGALIGRLLADAGLHARLAAGARELGEASSGARVAERAEAVYEDARRRGRRGGESAAGRILCDFHMHTEHSHDCATPVEDLVDRAVSLGLGAIAVTDHNTIAGGLAARRYAEEQALPLHVIVGSEIKSATGEVIGLYLTEDVPRGMPFADTVEAIRAQGALVYVPHPFDRLHAIPDAALLERLVDRVDVLETYNARLFKDSFNRDAAAFAQRHDLLAGAGSDAHVLEGLGTGAVELPRFADAESLLVALGAGRVVRRPANLLYLQGLKWMRQARNSLRRGER
jgi:predicted metal-dependent phosphoesterase TrpH/glycosyltransferase involved in cell wall biosynthesis